jgi:hypothetical protein
MRAATPTVPGADPVARRPRARRFLIGLGVGFSILALAALGYELALAWQAGGYRMIAAGELWYALDRGSLNLAQAITQRYLHPAIWDPLLVSVLQWPAWALLGAPGAALLVAFAPRRGA